jgi:hypothetical protein
MGYFAGAIHDPFAPPGDPVQFSRHLNQSLLSTVSASKTKYLCRRADIIDDIGWGRVEGIGLAAAVPTRIPFCTST